MRVIKIRTCNYILVFYASVVVACIYTCYTEARIRTRNKGQFREVINNLRRRPYDIHRSNKSTFCDNPQNARSKRCNFKDISNQDRQYYPQRKTRRQIRTKRRNQRKQRLQQRHSTANVKKPKTFETAGHFENSNAQPKLNQFADTFREWSNRYTDYHLFIFVLSWINKYAEKYFTINDS